MLNFKGRFIIECFDKNGKKKWEDEIHNTIMDAAINDILDVYFNSGSATATFYVALIRDDNFTGIAGTDTAASHPGWEEADSEYSETTRRTWTIVAPASQQVTNSASPAEFNIVSAQTMKGAALFTNNVKGGSTGLLVAAGLFTGGDKVLTSGDLIRVTYQISATG